MNRTLFFAVSLATVSLFGQSTPDLSGTWKLNVDKSDFGPLPPPSSRIDVITQNGTQIRDAVSQKGSDGSGDMTMVYNTDGTSTTNQFRGTDVKSTGKWDGGALLIQSQLVYEGQDVTVDAKWTTDGKSLTEAVHFTTAQGEADQTLVFEKQTGGAAPAPASAAAPTPAAPATATPAASVGTHPNFSGTWKLNVGKSDFGPIPPPDSRIDKIDHKEPAIKVSFTSKGGQGDQSGELNFTTDGKPNLNSVGGNDLKGRGSWDGAALVLDNTLNVQGSDIQLKTRWELSADGKVLTQAGHIAGPMGELDVTYVFEKQAE